MKRRIKQNVWGNWKGYEGNRKVEDFGTDEQEAQDWLKGLPRTKAEPLAMTDWKKIWEKKP